jgi:hypothetical protein
MKFLWLRWDPVCLSYFFPVPPTIVKILYFIFFIPFLARLVQCVHDHPEEQFMNVPSINNIFSSQTSENQLSHTSKCFNLKKGKFGKQYMHIEIHLYVDFRMLLFSLFFPKGHHILDSNDNRHCRLLSGVG